jgi:hypothetical protein
MSVPKNFWRLSPSAIPEGIAFGKAMAISSPSHLIYKLRPRHGIVLATWDGIQQLGLVSALGIVIKMRSDSIAAEVLWRPAQISLYPKSSGRRYWSQPEPFFGFAREVVSRYMLDDLFAEHFPEYSEMEFGARPIDYHMSQKRFSTVTPGFVYVVKSPYGYKIGKTVNMKDRMRLFGVKLPFPISVEHYAYFEDYSLAESEFHRMFNPKRLEGEWERRLDDR